MSIDLDTDFPFYRDRFTPAQRRRVEALIVVKRLWPFLDSAAAVQVAMWVISGNRRRTDEPVEAHDFVSRPRKVSG